VILIIKSLFTLYLLVSIQEFGHQPPDWLKEIASSSGIERNVKLQSWTKVLGQICTFGAFAHTPGPNTSPA